MAALSVSRAGQRMSEVIRRNSIFRSLEVGDSPGPHPRASHCQRDWKMNTGSWPKTVDIASNCKQLHPGSASAYPRMVERDTGHNLPLIKRHLVNVDSSRMCNLHFSFPIALQIKDVSPSFPRKVSSYQHHRGLWFWISSVWLRPGGFWWTTG